MAQAIFWDLQGTLGGDATGDVTAFSPYPFAKEALKLARDHGFLNIVITNQSRIGKGLLAQSDFDRKKAAILAYFRVMGFAYFVVDGKKIMFAVMMCAMLSIMSLADGRYFGMQVIIIGTAIQMALYNWILIMNLKRRKPRPTAEDDTPVTDEGGFRHIR